MRIELTALHNVDRLVTLRVRIYNRHPASQTCLGSLLAPYPDGAAIVRPRFQGTRISLARAALLRTVLLHEV